MARTSTNALDQNATGIREIIRDQRIKSSLDVKLVLLICLVRWSKRIDKFTEVHNRFNRIFLPHALAMPHRRCARHFYGMHVLKGVGMLFAILLICFLLTSFVHDTTEGYVRTRCLRRSSYAAGIGAWTNATKNIWAIICLRCTERGIAYTVRDPREAGVQASTQASIECSKAMCNHPVFPGKLKANSK